jgi:hypothetical protein
VKIFTDGIKGTHFGKKCLQLLAQALAAHRNHFRHQQPGENAVLLRNVTANR